MNTKLIFVLFAMLLRLVISNKLLKTKGLFCITPCKGLKSLNTTTTTEKQTDSYQELGCAARCLSDLKCFYAVSERNNCYMVYEAVLLSDVVDDLSSSIVTRPYKGWFKFTENM